MCPFIIWHWGTVGDINGYRTPFAKLGEYKVLYPYNEVMFGVRLTATPDTGR